MKIAGLLLLCLGCSSGTAVSSTTTAHKNPDYAPPPPDNSARDVSGDAPIPAATDPQERVVYLHAGAVYMMHADGSESTRVTSRSPSAADEAPQLSPKGDAVVFASAREGVSKIFLAPLDGTGARAITDGADGGDVEPAWSGDGKRIVFVRGHVSERRDLFIVDTSGGKPTLLLEGNDLDPTWVGWPAWSPDGKEIVFSADRNEGSGTALWLVHPDGGGLRRLTRPPVVLRWVRDVRSTWSPDGKRIAFASNRHAAREDDAGDLDVYDLDVASGTISRLTRDPAVADDPSYSPDGKRLYFASTRDAVRPFAIELFVMPARGGEQRRMTRDEFPENAAPSGGRLP